MTNPCPFCSLDKNRIIAESDDTLTFRDGFPVSPGHTLIIPKRHVASFFDITSEERSQLLTALEEAKQVLDRELAPDGFNIGVNNGEAAGQTVMHLHLHLVPRYHGDCEDPRGGIRWVIPGRANYWDPT